MPDHLLGNEWRFASLIAATLEQDLFQQPMPIQSIPANLCPSRCGLPEHTPIPGVVVYGGRRSLKLAQWLAEQTPKKVAFVQGDPSGLTLATGLDQRWVFLTFTDTEVIKAAQTFEQRKALAQGLHFLLVQPDDSGVTYTGLFLLQAL
jgi:RNA-binding protein Tab2/Atab2